MKFNQAISLLSEGKKIRRTCWESGHYWQLDCIGHLVNSLGDTPTMNRKQIESDDWETFNDKFNLSEQIQFGEFDDEIIPAEKIREMSRVIRNRFEFGKTYEGGVIWIELRKILGDRLWLI